MPYFNTCCFIWMVENGYPHLYTKLMPSYEDDYFLIIHLLILNTIRNGFEKKNNIKY